ncbi:MAG: ccpA 3 [Herbinix sp.]|jgi:DNA-binding LacI/PurR family transcriptional regulator|nr:ccpA 3 [Herbinix sp.]
MAEKEHITITQIAELSNVSIATVSRVLNGNVSVSPDKRKRVEEVIQKYNFSPNALARGLISKQTKTIGVILPDISNPYFSSMFLEIERSALEAGYTLLLCNTLFGGSSHGIRNTKEESYYFQMMIDKQVDGVLIIGGQVDLTAVEENYKQALKRLVEQLPVVVIGKEIEDIDCIFIHPENGQSVTSALNYLYMLGHRKIAFVGGQPNVTITEDRLNAYKKALQNLGLTVDDSLISLSDYYSQDGYTAMNNLISRNASFTAFLAINDNVALGAERALYDQSMKVPDDIAVISCDQFLTGEYHIPRLTSINQHHDLLARLVITTLINAIQGNANPPKFTITTELVIRESCGTHLGIRNHAAI